MTRSFDETLNAIAAAPGPAWLWDSARRRIVFANAAALAYWGEEALEDLIERRFTSTEIAARMSGAPAALQDGRPGLLVEGWDGAEADPDADLFAEAPLALALFARDGACVRANEDAAELIFPGDLSVVLASPEAAADFIARAAERGTLARTLPVVTRFGLRRCRLTARATAGGVLIAFDDLEDRLALQPADAPPAPTPAPRPLAPTRNTLPDLVAALADPALAADAQGRVIAMNARAAQLLGESAQGEPLLNMLPPDLKADAAAYIASSGLRGLERALEDGRESRVQQGDESVPVRVAFARLDSGEILVQFRDLSADRALEHELRRARAEAEQASEQKSAFLAGISHELRTPLNAIIGFAEIMEQERLGPIGTEKYREYVHDIRESGALLLSLINDLLDISKAESGRIELDPDAVELRPIVMSVLSLLTPQADRLGVKLRASVEAELPPIVADERSLKQILINLAANAVKFSRESGEVEIACWMDDGGAVHIAVRDNGQGMTEADIRNALQPYGRTSSSKGREGTGLGLPLAKALAEANKAQFAIDSTPDRGTTVSLTFPSALVLAG